MTNKEKPDSKISTTQTNTNRKKKTGERGGPWGVKTALFKKNDAALIIVGALVVTLVVFFVFFRSSGTRTEPESPPMDEIRLQALETRLSGLEQSLAALESKVNSTPRTNVNTELAEIRKQMATLESGFLIRLEALERRTGRMEEISSAPKPLIEDTPRVVTANPDIQEKKALAKPSASSTTTDTAQEFHTVQKGETLWRISQKYGTTVDRLRELNDLAPGADIYSGTKIRVR